MKKMILTLCILITFAEAFYISRLRLKRNVFDPSIPSFPNPNIPFFQPWPYPVGSLQTPSPMEKFFPQPPEDYPSNPFLAHMNDAYNPNFGFGFSYLPGPTLLGGAVHFPSDDIFTDKNTVSGTFVRSAPLQVRMGTQGGSLYPWMDKRYPDAVQAIDYIGRQGNFQKAMDVKSGGNGIDEGANKMAQGSGLQGASRNVPYEQSGLPPLPST